MLSEVKHALNTFENAFIKIFFFEILYDIKSRDSLLALTFRTNDLKKEKFLQRRQEIRNDVKNAIKLTQIKMTILYDRKHRSEELTSKAYIKMIKIKISEYHLPNFSSLSVKKIEPFLIIRKIEDLTYELELPSFMRIHLVISVTHLEQAIEDKFDRSLSIASSPVIVEDQNH